MRRLTLHASPMQKLSGIVLRQQESLRVAITVLPKMWRPAAHLQNSRNWTLEWSSGSLSAVLYEGDVVTVEISGDHLEQKHALLESLMTECGATGAAEKVLFSPTPTPRQREPLPANNFEEAAIDLMRLADLAGIEPLDATAGEFYAAPVEIEWLLPFLHRRFVRAVTNALRHARRGYVEQREILDTIRGKPLGESLARALATRVPAVECEFEVFEYATPLLRTIAAGLEAVARASLPAGLPRAALVAQVAADNTAQAISLRHQISEVPTMPARDAIRIARTARLHRLERAWEPALRVIDPILRRNGALADFDLTASQLAEALAEQGSSRFLRVEIPTAQVWENLLRASARTLGTLLDGAVHPPWEGGVVGDPKPDIDLVVQDHMDIALPDRTRLIMDAKYKPMTRGVDIADAYQMFAYSHLMKDEPKVSSLFLVYPDPCAMNHSAGYRRMPQRHDGPMRLNVVSLAWPSRNDLATPDAYKVELVSALARRITAMA